MSVTHTARIGKVAMFFDMQLSHNNIMQILFSSPAEKGRQRCR